VKTVYKLPDGRTRRFGRNRPVASFPVLHLANYIDFKALPPPPATTDYTSNPVLAPAVAQIYGNDKLGDCVVAEACHATDVFEGNAGDAPVLFSSSDYLGVYSGACGYVPGDPATDQGCDMQTVLAYVRQHGIGAAGNHKIDGWAKVDVTDVNTLQTALWLFENLDVGMELPGNPSWLDITANGFVWDVAGPPNPQYGHCVLLAGYDATTTRFIVLTWGLKGFLTLAALQKYAAKALQGEIYCVLSQEIINKASQKAPNGFAYADLVNDLNALGGSVTPPTPPPPVPPVPTTFETGSAGWFKLLLPADQWEALQTAWAEPVSSKVVGTPGWFHRHISPHAYLQVADSFEAA
jgi:hypothetical protein